MTKHRVEITYFKANGTFYTTGDYVTVCDEVFEIVRECREKRQRGEAPGMVGDNESFFWLIRVPSHPHDHPTLLTPAEVLT